MTPAESATKYTELTFRQAILDSLSANIAVVDPRGEILAVNASWEEFAKANEMTDGVMGIGANYLEVCRAAITDPNARAALEGILEVMNGKRPLFFHVYPCHSPWEKRWFAMRVTPLVDYPTYVVVSHENITDRFEAGIAHQPG